MKAERIPPSPPKYRPILLTLETADEALVLKYLAHVLTSDDRLRLLPSSAHFTRKTALDILYRMWYSLGSLGVDYTDGKA